MSDPELILELTKAIREDTVKPTIDQQFNPTDPVSIEIVLHECDYAVEAYMERWKHYRERFADPTVYDAFVLEYQLMARKNVKMVIAQAQEKIAEELGDQQAEDGDEDGGV